MTDAARAYEVTEKVERGAFVITWLGVVIFAAYLCIRAADHYQWLAHWFPCSVLRFRYNLLAIAATTLAFSVVLQVLVRLRLLISADHARQSQHFAALYQVAPLDVPSLPPGYFDGEFYRADIRAAAQVHESAFFYSDLMAAEYRRRSWLLFVILMVVLLAVFLREINLYELAAVLFASEAGLTRVAQPYVAFRQMSQLQSQVEKLVARHLAGSHEADVIYAELLALYARYFDIKARCGVRTEVHRYNAAKARLTAAWKTAYLGFFTSAEKSLSGKA